MAFGITNDIFGIYDTPSLFRFRIPLDKIEPSLPDVKKIEVQYHIFSRTELSQSDLCKGAQERGSYWGTIRYDLFQSKSDSKISTKP
jgi:hypothetical protein